MLVGLLPTKTTPTPQKPTIPLPQPAKELIKGGGSSNTERPVILVNSDNLGDVLQAMSLSSTPAVYDFQGQEMKYSDRGSPTILSRGVKCCNGSIVLESTQSLVVVVDGVELDNICIVGGHLGLGIQSNGNVTLSACEVRGAKFGLWMEGNACLTAHHSKFTESADCGVILEGSSSANMTDCIISGASSDGIYMDGSASMVGNRIQITGTKSNVLNLTGKSKLSLTESTLTRNPGGQGQLCDEASLVLSFCATDGTFSTEDTATVEIKH